ncbi:T9SS type A sorting domain-containing protein, partial [bacterium]|nr:T9SS type A sorting domain-containing protein [bacterium]
NNRTEIMAYGGHIQAFGTEDDMVHFHPDSGGSGLYQWAGLWAKNGGSLNMNWAQFDSCDGSGGLQGGVGPGQMRFVNCRFTGNQGVYGDWRSSSSQDGWVQFDSCYVEGRVMFLGSDDSCWARACSLSQSVSQHECFYTLACSTAAIFEDCKLFDYTYRGGRVYGDVEFHSCHFDGNNAPSVYSYDDVELDSCKIDANNDTYGYYEAGSSATLKGRYSTFEGYATTGVYFRNDADFGTGEKDEGHNCFINHGATYTFDAAKKEPLVEVDAEFNYFDTLTLGELVNCSPSNYDANCVPDKTLSKVIGGDGKQILPETYSLGAAVPNPFNSNVAIEFDIPKAADVEFEVYNLLGNKVLTIVDEKLDRGRYRVVWDGRDSGGAAMPSGTYLYRLKSEDYEETKKMTLIK